MKLLLDQNLSHRLIKPLSEVYPESTQVSLLNLGEATDAQIWQHAKDTGYAIVSQDADFHEYSVLRGGPPLIIWMKCGNQPRQVMLEKLLNHHDAIEAAAQDTQIWCIEIY